MIIETILYTCGVISGLLINKAIKIKTLKNQLVKTKEIKLSDIPDYWQYNNNDKILIACHAHESYIGEYSIYDHLKLVENIKKNKVNIKENTYQAKISNMSLDLIEIYVDSTCINKLKIPEYKKFLIKPHSIIKNLTMEERLLKEKFSASAAELKEQKKIFKEIYG
jgi:hypothetical protein